MVLSKTSRSLGSFFYNLNEKKIGYQTVYYLQERVIQTAVLEKYKDNKIRKIFILLRFVEKRVSIKKEAMPLL